MAYTTTRTPEGKVVMTFYNPQTKEETSQRTYTSGSGTYTEEKFGVQQNVGLISSTSTSQTSTDSSKQLVSQSFPTLTTTQQIVNKKVEPTKVEPLYAPLDQAPYKPGMAPTIYTQTPSGFVNTGDKVSQTVVKNVGSGMASVSGVPYYQQTVSEDKGIVTSTETVSARGGIYTSQEQSISPNYRQAYFSNKVVPKTDIQLFDERLGRNIMESTVYKKAGEYTDIFLESATRGKGYGYEAGESAKKVKTQYATSIFEKPILSGGIFVVSMGAGGLIRQGSVLFPKTTAMTGSFLTGTYIGSTSVGYVTSKDKEAFVGKELADATLIFGGMGLGSKLASKYSTVQARALSMPKEVEILKPEVIKSEISVPIKYISKKVIYQDYKGFSGELKSPTMKSFIGQGTRENILGTTVRMTGKGYEAEVFETGGKTYGSVYREYAGKKYITIFGKGKAQIYKYESMKPIGKEFKFEGLGSIGISEPVKVAQYKKEKFITSMGERVFEKGNVYRQSLTSKTKGLEVKGDIYSKVKSETALGFAKSKTTKVLDVEYSIGKDLKVSKEYADVKNIKNVIKLGKSYKFNPDIVSMRQEVYQPTVKSTTRKSFNFVGDRTIGSISQGKKGRTIVFKQQESFKDVKPLSRKTTEINKVIKQDSGLQLKQKYKTVQISEQRLSKPKLKTKLSLDVPVKTISKSRNVLFPISRQTSILKSKYGFESKKSNIITPKSEKTLRYNTNQRIEQITKSRQKQDITSVFKPQNIYNQQQNIKFDKTSFNINKVPIEEIPTPLVKPSDSLFGGSKKSKGFSFGKGGKSKRQYSASLVAQELNIKGGKSVGAEFTGIGIRNIISKKRKKGALF